MKTPLAFGHMRGGIASVRGAKMRNFWTMLGVIIGVTSVITVVGIGEGVRQQISGQLHHVGNDLITVRPGGLHSSDTVNGAAIDQLAGLNISGTLTNQDISTVAGTKGVGLNAPLTLISGSLSGDSGSYKQGVVIGTGPSLSSLINQLVEYGSFLGDSDMGTHSAVLGQQAAAALFNEDVPLGRSFSFHGQRFVVEGIFNSFSSTPLSVEADFNNAVFIPNDVGETLTDNTAPTYAILAKPAPGYSTARVAGNVQKALDASHGGQSNIAVLQGNQNLGASDYILKLLTKLIAGVAAISLVVGGIGIMNVMLVSVAERMHEIGIRKAVGATNRQILNQFIIEATVLSLVGGIIGVALSVVISLAIRAATNLEPTLDWKIMVLAVAVSLLIGVIFGSFPAIKAARKDPIDALRSE